MPPPQSSTRTTTSSSSSSSTLLHAVVYSSMMLILSTIYVNVNVDAGYRRIVTDVTGHGGFLRLLERSIAIESPPPSTHNDDDGGAKGRDDGDDALGGPTSGQRRDRIDVLEDGILDLRNRNERMRERLLGLLDSTNDNDDDDDDGGGTTTTTTPDATVGGRMMGYRGSDRRRQWQEQQQRQRQEKQRPDGGEGNLTGLNILLLYADDWTHHTLSSYHDTTPKNTILKTPFLDALASDGMRFSHNCVTTSVCWISRATLYTGLYVSRHNTTKPCCWGGMDKPTSKMNETPSDWTELSFYELLANAGYHVGHSGKWGIYMPFDKRGVHYNVEEDGWHYRKIGDKLWHITEKNEADSLRFLVTRPRDRPFFLNVAFYATHAKDSDVRQYMPQEGSMGWYVNDTIPMPKAATDEAWKRMPYFFDERNEGRTRWRMRFNNATMHQTMMKNYYRMATEVDAACGAIMEELRRQDVLDNTVIIFTTDNGNFHAEHGLADKWYPHQESIRVPLIIRDPRMKEENRGTTNDEFTLNIDLAPTILAAAGLPIPQKMMGRDMSQLYLSPEPTKWRDDFFYEHPMISKKSYVPSSEALVRKDYKYMFWPDYSYEQLFDLVNDPEEMEDIFNSTDPAIEEIRAVMKKRFEELKNLVRSDEIVTL